MNIFPPLWLKVEVQHLNILDSVRWHSVCAAVRRRLSHTPSRFALCIYSLFLTWAGLAVLKLSFTLACLRTDTLQASRLCYFKTFVAKDHLFIPFLICDLLPRVSLINWWLRLFSSPPCAYSLCVCLKPFSQWPCQTAFCGSQAFDSRIDCMYFYFTGGGK